MAYFSNKILYLTDVRQNIHESLTSSRSQLNKNKHRSEEQYAFKFETTIKGKEKIEARILWNLVIIQCIFSGNYCSFPCLDPQDDKKDWSTLNKPHYYSYSSRLSLRSQRPLKKKKQQQSTSCNKCHFSQSSQIDITLRRYGIYLLDLSYLIHLLVYTCLFIVLCAYVH